jgi:hypothetical protein
MMTIRSGNPGICTRVIFATATAVVFAMMTVSVAEMQAKQPYDKDKLLRVVQLNALPTSEVVQAIQQRGVDFRMTSDIESQFRGAGARPEVIDAIQSHRGGASTPPPNNLPATPGNTRPSAVPGGRRWQKKGSSLFRTAFQRRGSSRCRGARKIQMTRSRARSGRGRQQR